MIKKVYLLPLNSCTRNKIIHKENVNNYLGVSRVALLLTSDLLQATLDPLNDHKRY